MAMAMAPDALRVLGVFRGIAEMLAQDAAGNGEYDTAAGFYLHLQARLMLVSVQVARVKPETFTASNLLGPLLERLEDLISKDILPTSPSPVSTAYPPRLNALLSHWEDAATPKLDTCKAYIDLSCYPDDELLLFLKDFEVQVTACFPEKASEPTSDYQPPKIKRQAPSEAIWAAAQSLFDAINASKCSDHPDHEFRARLGLGTYHGCHADECSTFDMFLALEHAWQEVHVKAFAKAAETMAERPSKVKFDDCREIKVPSKPPKAKRARVGRLCQAMEKARAFPTYRLQLAVEDGRLFHMAPEKSKLGIDKTKPPVSLQSFLTERPHSLREKTKRILAVFLAYAVFHLQGTPWLESAWDSGSIIFFETSSGIPLKPYIQLPLSDSFPTPHLPGQAGDAEAGEDEQEEEDDDDFDPYNFLSHPFPNLVTLAAMLIELHMARPITALADDYGLGGMYNQNGENSLFLLTLEIFDKCKLEISEQTRAAIDRCLDRNIGLHDDGGADMDPRELRHVIYTDVVQPLEDELHQGFQYIAIDELDQMAHTFDLGRWGRVLETQSREPRVPARPAPPATTAAPTRSQVLLAGTQAARQLSWASALQRGRAPSPVPVPPPVRLPRAISPGGDSSVYDTRTVENWVDDASLSNTGEP